MRFWSSRCRSLLKNNQGFQQREKVYFVLTKIASKRYNNISKLRYQRRNRLIHKKEIENLLTTWNSMKVSSAKMRGMRWEMRPITSLSSARRRSLFSATMKMFRYRKNCLATRIWRISFRRKRSLMKKINCRIGLILFKINKLWKTFRFPSRALPIARTAITFLINS